MRRLSRFLEAGADGTAGDDFGLAAGVFRDSNGPLGTPPVSEASSDKAPNKPASTLAEDVEAAVAEPPFSAGTFRVRPQAGQST